MLVAAERWAAAEAGSVLVLHLADQRGDRVRRGEAHKLLGVCERQRADFERALANLERARQSADDTEDALLLAEVLREVGETLRAQDRTAEARAALEQAAELFARIGAAADAVVVTTTLQRLIA
jgi:uncharacterized protein HemY